MISSSKSDSHSLALIAHADWGIGPRKRWLTVARCETSDSYKVSRPVPVEDAGQLIPNLLSQLEPHQACLLGFDFPIGLPYAYAKKAGIRNFRNTLLEFGQETWQDFYHVATQPDEISLYRPFYPAKAGQSHRHDLTQALGIPIDQLLRDCERGYEVRDQDGNLIRRRSACPLFWTLGGQQVGKAALHGWEKVIVPAIRNLPEPPSIWPFEGKFASLRESSRIVIVETYPAEYYSHLGIQLKIASKEGFSGKRSPQARIANAPQIAHWTSERGIVLDDSLSAWLFEGFGSSPSGEDAFDSLIGILGLLEVVLGFRPLYEPSSDWIRSIEGWIFGMDSPKFA